MTITAEQFMTQAEPDEEETFELLGIDPLISIAESLRSIAGSFSVQAAEQAETDGLDAVVRSAREAYLDLGEKYDELNALLEEIEALLKPSTSKLANSVREAITRWRAPEVPAELVHATPLGGKSPCGVHYMTGTFGTDPTCPVCLAAEQPDGSPAHDADVEHWREYASTVHPSLDFSTMNRSQIRTALGIEQPEPSNG